MYPKAYSFRVDLENYAYSSQIFGEFEILLRGRGF